MAIWWRSGSGPSRAYLVCHPELVRHVLLNPHVFDKGGVFDKARPLLGNSLSVSRGKDHRYQRRIIQPAFHTPRIRRLHRRGRR